MFPGNAELVARERRQEMLREAEQRRLIKTLSRRRPGTVQKMAYWTGNQLVKWGTRLQGQTMSLPPQPSTAGVTDTKCC